MPTKKGQITTMVSTSSCRSCPLRRVTPDAPECTHPNVVRTRIWSKRLVGSYKLTFPDWCPLED